MGEVELYTMNVDILGKVDLYIMKRLRKFMITYAPEKTYFYNLCCFIFFISFIQKIGPTFWNLNHYTYEYGFVNPWVIIHNNESLGMKRFIYMLINSNMGVEWSPQYIFIDATLVYLVMVMLNFIKSRLLKV